MIGLVDCNNFYVSCERIFDPSLEGKPVAVLSNNDGCVISRSNEFKSFQIAMGTPYYQLKPLAEKYHLILKSSNYELYGDISRRFLAVLGEFSPDIEQYSIDEAFIHVHLPAADYAEFGREIRRTILQWIGIPCGIGFAKTRTLAKIANHIGKKSATGVFVMPDNPEEILKQLPVREVWGIGRRLAQKLETAGLRTAWRLAMADEGFLQRKFNVTVARTALELRGVPSLDLGSPGELSQSISVSRSFGRPVVAFEELAESVAHYVAQAAEKLRKEKQLAAGVNIYFQYYPEYEPEPQEGGFIGTTIAFAVPTSNTGEMLQKISGKLRGIFIEGRRYKKSGVVFWGLESETGRELDLFAAPEQQEKNTRLSVAMDTINRQYGKNTLFHLSEGIERPWRMKRNFLSPNYTTSWEQLPEVK